MRIVHTDPLIHVAADPARPQDRAAAAGWRQAQYQAWDMLAGRLEPQLGGSPKHLDILGVNYYPHNQWFHGETGFICDSVEEMVLAARRLGELDRAACRTRVEECFSAGRMADGYEQVYQVLLQPDARRPAKVAEQARDQEVAAKPDTASAHWTAGGCDGAGGQLCDHHERVSTSR